MSKISSTALIMTPPITRAGIAVGAAADENLFICLAVAG
jgi:hypothetical protein